jgi:hypothetical protein
MAYVGTLSAHAWAVGRAATDLGLKACVQLPDFSLRIEHGGTPVLWLPKFIRTTDGHLSYASAPGAGVTGFAGWTPYGLRRWPSGSSKFGFKRFAAAHGIATPAACTAAEAIGGPFLVKHDTSSFGQGMRGPFLAHDAADPAQQLRAGEYYENFIPGLIAKAWCWGDRCLALHLEAPTIVTGDAQATLRELVDALPNSRGGANEWELIARLASCCGVASLDEVIPAGKQVLVEFRYGSRYGEDSPKNPNVWGRMRDARVLQQFADAATACAEDIASQSREGDACYTLDAIVDAEGTVWFLEMNCNPLVHPDLYAPMLASAFGHVAQSARHLPASDLQAA